MNIIEYLRQFKIGSFAIFDFTLAYGVAYLISPLIIKLFAYFKITVTKINIMWLVLPVSILTHIIVGTYTPLTKMFLNVHDYYTLKIIVLVMIYFGLKGVFYK
jgi:hypothetical protein